MADVNMNIAVGISGVAAVVGAIKGIAAAFGKGGLVGGLEAVGVAAGAAAIGLGVAAVNASSQFQQAMLLNEAHAGLAASQVNNVTSALLAMGPAVGQGPVQLAQALYPILSGFSGITDQAIKTQVSLVELKDAAMSVAGSTTSVVDVSRAATAAFNALGLATNDTATNTSRMNNLFDTMNATVSAGNMQWSNYVNVVGKLSVAARGAGVSFIEENSALADLTNSGQSAQLAADHLSNTFTALYLKVDTTAKNAHKLGLAFDETKYKSFDLAGKINYLTQITHGNTTEVLKLLNGNKTALETYVALSKTIGSYQSNLQALGHAQGATAQAFQTASQGFNFSMQQLQAAGQSLLITIGAWLLPIFTRFTNVLADGVGHFTAWLQSGHAFNDALTLTGKYAHDSEVTGGDGMKL